MQQLVLGASQLFEPFRSTVFSYARAVVGVATHEATIDGDRWSWIEAGPSDGEPLVLLHGFAGSKDNWMLIAPILAQKFRVICPDLPGFGDSAVEGSDDYSIRRQAARVVRFLDALNLAPCHIGGNSMGGYIALTIALDAPVVVRSLVLLNNAGVDGEEYTPAQDALRTGQDIFDIRDVEDVDRLLQMLLHRPPYLPWFLRQAMAVRLSRRRALEHQIFEQVLRDALDHRLNDRLGEVAVPTLVIWGRSDRLLHVSAADFQHGKIASSELVIFEDAGHVPMVERPFRTAREIESFLTRRASPNGG